MLAPLSRSALFVALAACAEPKPAPTNPPPPSTAPCKRWEEIIMSAEGAPNPLWAIDFARNSDALSENGKTGVENTRSLEMLAGDKPRVRRFAVVGHADADESDPQRLSERRAEVVMKALVERGIAADRMEVHGIGATPVRGAPPGTNRLVTFETLVDYRGGVRYWSDGGFVECTSDPSAAACGPTPEYTPRCLER